MLWKTDLPETILIDEHLPAELTTQAEALNVEIADFAQRREACDKAHEAVLSADPLEVDPAVLDKLAKEAKFSSVRVLRDEIVLREKLAEYLPLERQSREAVVAKLQGELEPALEQAKQALREAGFALFVDRKPLDVTRDPRAYDANLDHQFHLGRLLHCFPSVVAIDEKLRDVKESVGFHNFETIRENIRSITVLRNRLEELRRELAPAMSHAAG